jgi:uncharacterized protein YjbK
VSIHSANFDRPIVLRINALDDVVEVTIDQPSNAGFLPINATIQAGQTTTIDLKSWIDQIENKPANTIVPKGGAGVVVNTSHFFHLGIIHGWSNVGRSYG